MNFSTVKYSSWYYFYPKTKVIDVESDMLNQMVQELTLLKEYKIEYITTREFNLVVMKIPRFECIIHSLQPENIDLKQDCGYELNSF